MVRKAHYWGKKEVDSATDWNRIGWEIEQLPDLGDYRTRNSHFRKASAEDAASTLRAIQPIKGKRKSC